MILLKTVVVFVLANPAEFHTFEVTGDLDKPCGDCTYSIVNDYPKYTSNHKKLLDAWNGKYECGQANTNAKWNMKKNNVTETKNTKIVGGSNAQPHEFPWQVGIAKGYGKKIHCGGSIISSKSILTAAHCVQTDTVYELRVDKFPIEKCIYAVVGEHKLNEPRTSEKWIRICNIEVHDNYLGKYKTVLAREEGYYKQEQGVDYDFAVLTLCTELIFNEQVSPVCLPQPIKVDSNGNPIQYEQYEKSESVLTSGWGKVETDRPMSDVLQKLEMTVLTNDNCFNSEDDMWKREDISAVKICAKSENKGICGGDYGGPLVIQNIPDNRYTLIGVTSFTYATCTIRPDIFARVSEVMTWINEKDKGVRGLQPVNPPPAAGSASAACPETRSFLFADERTRKNKNIRSLKNTEGVIYYRFEKDKKLSRNNAQETCISKYGGQLTSINTKDEYEWIKEQVKDLKMFGQIAIGGQWKDKNSRKFEWTDESEMDMSVLNANWFRTRNYQFPSYKNKKRINLELWYSRRALGFANALDHKAPTMYICKVAESCTSCSSCSA